MLPSLLNRSLKFYIDQKFWIFPCKPIRGLERIDKTPYTLHGFKDAVNTLEKAIDFWKCYPDALIGIDCGRSQIIAIDIDNKKDRKGSETWLNLETKYGMTPTWQSQTPSNGSHIIYKRPVFPIIPSYGDRWPGIDIKSEGGYICAPGNGSYRWHKQSHPTKIVLADLPDWLIDLLKKDIKQRSQPTHDIPEGSRNSAMTSLLGGLRRNGATLEQLKAEGLNYNLTRLDIPLAESEIFRIAKSVFRYEPETKSFKPSHIKPKSKIKPSAIAIHIGQYLKTTWQKREVILDPLFGKGEFSILCAREKTGKSVVSMQLWLSLGTGVDFCGMNIDRPHRTMLLQPELNNSLFRTRLEQMIPYYPTENNENLIMESFDDNDVNQTLDDNIEWLERYIEENKLACLIIDSIYMYWDVDEKEGQAIGKIFKTLKRLTLKYNIHLFVTHHVRKSAQDRLNKELTWDDIYGAAHIKRAVDTMLLLDDITSDIPVSQIPVDPKNIRKLSVKTRAFYAEPSTWHFTFDKTSCLFMPISGIKMKKRKANKRVGTWDLQKKIHVDGPMKRVEFRKWIQSEFSVSKQYANVMIEEAVDIDKILSTELDDWGNEHICMVKIDKLPPKNTPPIYVGIVSTCIKNKQVETIYTHTRGENKDKLSTVDNTLKYVNNENTKHNIHKKKDPKLDKILTDIEVCSRIMGRSKAETEIEKEKAKRIFFHKNEE